MNEQSNVKSLVVEPPKLPNTVEEVISQRILKTTRTINDQIDEMFLALWSNEDFRSYINAIHDSQAVEGSLDADDFMAAQMIRDKAKKVSNVEIGRLNLATIAKCLHVVMRRYQISRNGRRNTVHGELIQNDNGE